ncbi:MAG: ABC transporter ATP-binding protein [Spirochaetes bacterium]|nr:ABC transporter ATP-binding protein [Spirochaetota bacterium]
MLTLHNIYWQNAQFTLSIPFLEFADHAHCMIMGRSGSGKTLLLSIIAGIVKPQSGNVLVDGGNITSVPPHKRGIAMVYQEPLLFPHLSVYENICFGLVMQRVQKTIINDKAHEAMKLCNIEHLKNRDTRNLSGGEKQRVAFARAIVTEPRILLLDEPFTSLDPVSKEELVALLQRIKKYYNPMIIHVTHDFDETVSMGDYLYVLSGGKIIQHGSVLDVYRYPQDVFVAAMVGARNIFTGKLVHSKEGAYFVTHKGLRFFLGNFSAGNPTHAIVRSEDIIIAKRMQHSSATNQFKGVVTDITEIKGLYKVSIDIGETIQSVITKRSLISLNIKKGAKVVVIFKGSAVYLL